MAQSTFHSQSVHDTVRQLDAQLATGLSQVDAQNRLREFGENALPEEKRTSLLRMFLQQFRDFIVLLLLAAVVVSFILGDSIEAAAILAIVLLNAVIGLVQEQRADAALAELRKLAAPDALVLRDGVRQSVPARELVPGDILFLEAGNYTPADLHLIESVNLSINESTLTGESAPVRKQAEHIVATAAPLGDRINMAFSGTLITQGRGRGIVTATGLGTEMGMIAQLMASIENEATPLQRRLDQLGKSLSVIALGLCTLVFAVEIVRNTDLGLIASIGFSGYLRAELDAIKAFFVLAVSLAVAAVPEGLAAIVTINLAIGMREMVKHHALIRRLTAVETLGSTTIICSDKTGTLTQNIMTVVRAYAGGLSYRVTGEPVEPKGDVIEEPWNTHVRLAGSHRAPIAVLLRGALLSSDAILEKYDDHYRIVGDATEGALVCVAAKTGLWRDEVERELPRVDELPFDADRKMMTTIHQSAHSSGQVLFTKGAPDIVLARCAAYLDSDGHPQALDSAMRDVFEAVNASMAAQALRVLAVATRFAADGEVERCRANLETNLTFVGLLGMIDPPRPEAARAIQTAREAGIQTVMITGDYSATAQAIATQIGLDSDDPADVITGPELQTMDDDTLAHRARRVRVFARVSPEHKVRIVSAFKHNGHIVAMTGDGVNDAPALKRADIGIAMGITGTDVSKETADMVLTDDNFASIVAAVAQGRVVYANIRKFVAYLLASNIAEIAVVLLTTLVGLKSPLTALQLLWMNLMTDGAPALALGLERAEPDLMHRAPRDPKEPILNKRMLIMMAVQTSVLALCVIGIYVLALQAFPVKANTMAFGLLSLSQLPLAYVWRSEHLSLFEIGVFSNPKMQWAVLLSVVGISAVIYVPFMNRIFATEPLGAAQLAWVLAGAFVPSIAAECAKYLLRAKRGPDQAKAIL